MKKLEITQKAAQEAMKNADKTGKKLLIDLFGLEVFELKITDRINTFKDVLDEVGMTEEDFENSGANLCSDEIAYKKLKLIAHVLNEGWKPNWEDDNEYKYWPYFYIDSAGSACAISYHSPSSATASVGSRLCFKSRELALYAGRQFLEIYKEYIF